MNRLFINKKPLLYITCIAFICAFLLTGCGTLPAASSDDNSAFPDMTAAAAIAGEVVSLRIADLQDDYAYYFTADEYRMMVDDYEGSFGGIGVSMVNDDDNNVIIYNVMDDTPAAGSGIAMGDCVIAVNGEDITGLGTSEAVLRIRGEIGTYVHITLRRAESEETYDVTLTRAQIHTESLLGETMADVPDTAYIRIYDFNEETLTDFVNLYSDLNDERPIKNIILDLRANGGGSFYAAINIANYFVPNARVIVQEKTSIDMTPFYSNSGMLNGIKLYILQDQWSASASEVLIGALRDNAGAVLIGDTSYGKGITQTLASLSSGSGLRYTRGRYYTPNGYDLHELGIAPDHLVPTPASALYEEYFSMDTEKNLHLQKAIELIMAAQQPEPGEVQ